MAACIGTRWRYRENAFLNSKGELVHQKRVRLLKNKSCNGKCQPSHYECQSYYANDCINEFISGSGDMPDIPKNAQSGDELKLIISLDCDGEIDVVHFVKSSHKAPDQ